MRFMTPLGLRASTRTAVALLWGWAWFAPAATADLPPARTGNLYVSHYSGDDVAVYDAGESGKDQRRGTSKV